MHHTITDGEGGVRMSERMVDLGPEADDPEPVRTPEPETIGSTLVDLTLGTFGHGLRRGAGVAQRTTGWAGEAARHPDRVLRAGTGLAEATRSAARQLLVTDRAHSPLWRSRSLNRWFGTLDVPFDDAKRAAENLGGSLNDLFVTGAAGAAGAYHRARGAEVEELRMAMPVSTRHGSSAGGNAFAPMRVLVPAGDEDVAHRFEEVRRRLTTTKTERAIGLIGGLAGFINILPTSVLVRFGRQQMETIDFTTSNVRAAPFDLYIAGARVEATYPLGPLAGTAFNLTMMSYSGALNIGLHVDRRAVDEPELLRDCLEEAYAELVAAGS
jgi:WS/DGAT/MGAT family acyltransferase